MTHSEALQFAVSSALQAIDQRDDFASIEDAVDSYRDNIRDTLNDEGCAEFEPDAWAAFDAKIVALAPFLVVHMLQYRRA